MLEGGLFPLIIIYALSLPVHFPDVKQFIHSLIIPFHLSIPFIHCFAEFDSQLTFLATVRLLNFVQA